MITKEKNKTQTTQTFTEVFAEKLEQTQVELASQATGPRWGVLIMGSMVVFLYMALSYNLFWEGVANQMAVQAQLQPVASQPVFDFSDPMIDVDIMTTSEMSRGLTLDEPVGTLLE